MAPIIKEYHFHTYYFQCNDESKEKALNLYNLIKDLTAFIAIPHKFNEEPVGPHPIGSFETWVPQESFAEAYSWFLLNRGDLSILIHPLTRDEIEDHTVRAVWMGDSLPLDGSPLSELLPEIPAQYPDLELGYSKKPWHDVPKPTLAADIVLFVRNGSDNDEKVLLIQRKYEPFKDCWALPGGHVDQDEPLEVAARRELKEETGIEMEEGSLYQFHTFSAPGRDPRGWTVSVAYVGMLIQEIEPDAGDDAKLAQWFSTKALPELAFDHKDIIHKALESCEDDL